MKKHFSTILIIFIFLIGLSVLLYPSVSNFINMQNSSKIIAGYDEIVKNMSKDDKTSYFEAAHEYNERIAQCNTLPPKEGLEGYDTLLNVNETGVMGRIEFVGVNIKLPIFHGTGEAILQSGVGHMPQTSLPVGGENTHAVITGHRGLPSAKLFTDLDKVAVGDVFYLYILDNILAYRVDQIKVVDPYDTKDLMIVKGGDYVTCVTCTPYGINTQRLLIRGIRVSYESTIVEKAKAEREAELIDPSAVAPFLAAPVLLVVLAVLLVKSRRSRKHKADSDGFKHE